MALTTPSTSRCVRSGKSVHNFSTSSERIIGNPAAILWTGPNSPRTRDRLRTTLSGNSCPRKPDLTGGVLDPNGRETPPYQLLLLFGLGLRGGSLFFQCCAKDVAERRARVRAAVLRDRLLFLGDLHRLDREIGLLRAVKADHERIELLPDLEPLGTLLVAVAAEIGALDKTDRPVVADLNVEPGILDRANGDGQRVALLHPAGTSGRSAARAGSSSARAAALELLHAERDPLLLDIDVEHLGFHCLEIGRAHV